MIAAAETQIPASVDTGQMLAREAATRIDISQLVSGEAEQFIVRVKCLAQWMPELELPRWADDLLRDLLPDLCAGRSSLIELRQAPVVDILKARLMPRQLAMLEQHAPARFTVPSGRQVALRYELGQPPVLAVRIQEMFGLAHTPRIAAGRVPVLLHLLAPSDRAQQITSDLASFWRATYPQIRNELRRRYPKHSWPENPLTAAPECSPGRKR